MPPTVLLTRPQADSQRFAARLAGAAVVISPVLRIVPVAHDAARLAKAPGLVFTSVHAVPAAGPGRGRVAFCVGPRTAAVARAAGFAVTEGPGDAAGLAPLLAQAELPLIHPRGAHLARDLGVPGVVVYDQRPAALTDQARALLAGRAPVILPLFSPRSARLLAEQAWRAAAPLWLAAISATTDAAWDAPAAYRGIAAKPAAESMPQLVQGLIDREQS